MGDAVDFRRLCEEIKQISALTARDEATLHELAALIVPSLDGVTDRFYATLGKVRCTAEFIEGRVGILKNAHRAWLESLFTRNLDAEYAEWVFRIGAMHVRVELPVEFVTASMSLILRELLLVVGGATLDAEAKARACAAIASVCAFCQLIMLSSYGRRKLASGGGEVQKLTDVSRKLFDDLAALYKEYASPGQGGANDPRADIRLRRRGIYANGNESNRRPRRVPRGHT